MGVAMESSETYDLPSTSVLLIDGFKTDRAYWTKELQSRSPDYEILEASDGQSGLEVCKSRQVDCVVLEITLPDISGLEVLMTLVPRASKPRIAVIVLSQLSDRGIWELAKEHGAYVCFVKQHTTGEDLDRAIQRAVALVGELRVSELSMGGSFEGSAGEEF